MKSEVLNKLDNLARLCKASVHVTYNEHTTNYESVEEYVRWRITSPGGNFEEEKPEDLDKMIKDNKVVEVQFYPHTPIGHYVLLGYDLEKLLDEAIKIAQEEQKK